MEIVMLGVTVVSLLLAFVMSAVAWRLSRQERARSAARVAALAAAANETEAAIPERIAVGESRPSAPWNPARVSAFAPAPPSRPSTQSRAESVDVMRPLGSGFLDSAVTTPPSRGRQRGLAVAALILFVAALGGGYWTVFGGRTAASTVVAANRTASPLELVSLRHERRGQRLAVTGLVRNPAAGAEVDKLTAVAFLFDPQGGFITSARANVDFLKLAPGDESPFVINLEAPANVARYRVSFRNEAGLVPHVDRRGQEPIALTQISR
jgi:hypothetical protein